MIAWQAGGKIEWIARCWLHFTVTFHYLKRKSQSASSGVYNEYVFLIGCPMFEGILRCNKIPECIY